MIEEDLRSFVSELNMLHSPPSGSPPQAMTEDFQELSAESFNDNELNNSDNMNDTDGGGNQVSYQQEDADDDYIKNCPEHTVLSDILSRCCYFVTVQEPSVQASD